MKAANEPNHDEDLYNFALDTHYRFIEMTPEGHSSDFMPRKELIESSSKAGLAATLGVKAVKIEICDERTSNPEEDLFSMLGDGFLDAIRNTQKLSNIYFVHNRKRYPFIPFYKRELAGKTIKEAQKVLSEASIIILCENHSKQHSIAIYSACLAYFTILIRLKYGPGSCFDQGRKIGAEYTRIVLFGTPSDFLEALENHDFEMDKISNRGVLKSALFRYFLDSKRVVNKVGIASPISSNGTAQINFGLSKKLKLENIPMGGAFFIRDVDNNILTLARHIGKNKFGKDEFSYVQTNIDKNTEMLKYDALNI